MSARQPGDLDVLAAWAPELADTFVALSCDIALVIDSDGCIATLAQHDTQPIAPPAWIGTRWVDTVSPDSRGKIEQMLAEVSLTGQTRRREINHPQAVGGTAAVAYSAARLGELGPTLVVGHDLRVQAAMQQRFVAAQEALERSYWKAQQGLQAKATGPSLLTDAERERLGLDINTEPSHRDLDDSELVRALGRLVERIGHEELQGLLRDARHLAERHFLARALARAGSAEALGLPLAAGTRRPGVRRKTTKPPS